MVLHERAPMYRALFVIEFRENSLCAYNTDVPKVLHITF